MVTARVNMIDHIELVKKLISFPSVTPSDCGAIEYIAGILEKAGFTIYIKEFGPKENPKHTKNLYAIYHHNASSPTICFAGHIDVVPAQEGWHYPPFSATTEDGKIYGRGAVDMKGALGCMIASAVNFLKSHPKSINLAFLITSDEEGDAYYGTKAMLEWMHDNGHNIDFAIVGEPTSQNQLGDVVKIGRRGSINFTLKINGIAGHVAYPDLAQNPNPIMIKILNDLLSLKLDDGDDFFAPSNLEITSIDSNNNVSNVIPSYVIAKFNIRFIPKHNEQSLISSITEIVERYSTSYTLEHKCNAYPFLSKTHDFTIALKDAIMDETGIKTIESTSGGTSDARFIYKYCPVLEFGLLSGYAHKIDEHVKILDLQRLYNVYYSALNKMLITNERLITY